MSFLPDTFSEHDLQTAARIRAARAKLAAKPNPLIVVTADCKIRAFNLKRLDALADVDLRTLKGQFDSYHYNVALRGASACTPPDDTLLDSFSNAEVRSFSV